MIMKFLQNKFFWLILITGFGLLLRLYRVAYNPPALSWDEVSIGYNAYSILKTGFDEHHRFLPLDSFVGYGDYKPPFAIYATVPFIAIFGLNELAVRLPSVLFGSLTILISFFLVSELFTKTKVATKLGLLTSLILTISPWHIMLSRAGFEGNIALFFIVAGIYLCLKTRDNPILFKWMWLPFVISVYTFNSSRYVVPFLSVGIVIFLFPHIRVNIRQFIFGIVIGIISLLPIIPHLISPQARLRFAEVNIFSDLSVIKKSNERIVFDGNTLFAKVIHNRRYAFLKSFLTHYFDHFQPNFLFIKGDGNPKFSIQNTGQFYIIEAPLLVLGMLLLYLRYPKIAFFLTYWLVVSIIPSATARETPHALRIENSLPTWQIFIAYTLVSISSFNFRGLGKIILFSIIGGLYLFESIYFLHTYFTHYPKQYSGEWQFGYRQAIQASDIYYPVYKHIVISDTIGRPYMYTLFYEKFDPGRYWQSVKSGFDAAGFYDVKSFDKYIFVRGAPASYNHDSLYILDPTNMPDNAHILKTIKLLNDKTTLVIFDLK
jgi:4-amino-4-deoxy-L-arabinose transferase-like glycosyltransferase